MQRRSGRQLARAVAMAVAAASLATGTSVAQSPPPADTLRFAWASQLGTLDPAIAYDTGTLVVEHALWDTLVTYDDGTTLVPGLAAAMPTISDDGLTYTFQLRPDVPFVRHGEVLRTVTADDVVHSLNRVLRPDMLPTPSPVGGTLFALIEGADAVLDGSAETASGLRALDDDTVEITLTSPDRTFLNVLAMPFGSIVPAELAGLDSDAFAADPVGTGPFYVESYDPDERLVLARNPHYWGDAPALERVEMRVAVEAETQFDEFRAGTIDIMGDAATPEDWATIVGDPALGDQLVQTPNASTLWLAMDTSGPDSPFRDPLVRQAVNHAVDKDAQVAILAGRAQPADCIFPPRVPGFDPDCGPYPHDATRAQALMDEAGNPGFATQLYTDDSTVSGDMARAIAQDLAPIGIDVEVVQQDFDTYWTTLFTPHAAPLVLTGWFQDFPDPATFIDPVFGCAAAVEGGSNAAWYCDEAFDARALEARRTIDLEEALPVYQELQRDLMAAAPVVPLFHDQASSLVAPRVTGFTEFHPVWLFDLPAYGVGG